MFIERQERRLLTWLLPVRPTSVGVIVLVLVIEPRGDVARWNRSSWQMRNDSSGVDDQPLIEFRTRELPGFLFSLECLGRSRTAPSLQRAAFVHFKGNIPGMRHLSLDQALETIQLGDVLDVRRSRAGSLSVAVLASSLSPARRSLLNARQSPMLAQKRGSPLRGAFRLLCESPPENGISTYNSALPK